MRFRVAVDGLASLGSYYLCTEQCNDDRKYHLNEPVSHCVDSSFSCSRQHVLLMCQLCQIAIRTPPLAHTCIQQYTNQRAGRNQGQTMSYKAFDAICGAADRIGLPKCIAIIQSPHIKTDALVFHTPHNPASHSLAFNIDGQALPINKRTAQLQ